MQSTLILSQDKQRILMEYLLIKTTRRLTFDILYQNPKTINAKHDENYSGRLRFQASNGYDIISDSRMDIQTERLWLIGNSTDSRSGSMVFSSNAKRDLAYAEFVKALNEWAQCVECGEWAIPKQQ